MSNKKANFYMMPGDPLKKLDTPGGFSYKAESTMNKLGMGPINDGHEAMANMGHDTPTNDGYSPVNHKVDGKDHTSKVDGHKHENLFDTAKNYLRNSAANIEVRYGSSGQQGGMAQRRPDKSFKIFGPPDKDLENQNKS
jgi:hypothetical protein